MGDLDFLNLNPQEAVNQRPSSILPIGRYTVAIANAEVKRTKNLDGLYLELDLVVTGGEHDGRHVFDKANIKNASENAVLHGKATLGAIALALGMESLKDSQELVGKVLDVEVTIEKGEAGYSDKNKVRQYLKVGALAKVAAQAQRGDGPPF